MKRDLDSEMDTIEELHTKKEELFSDDEDARVMSSLELIPVVYTTRLDDMAVFNHLTDLRPKQVTDRILRESKPKLLDYPSNDNRLHNKISFRVIKAKLNKIYKNNVNEEPDVKPDIFTSRYDPLVIKHKEAGQPINTCKYNELLKLCKPFSIVLTKLIEFPSSMSKVMELDDEPLITEVNNVSEVTVISSSDEDERQVPLNAPIIPESFDTSLNNKNNNDESKRTGRNNSKAATPNVKKVKITPKLNQTSRPKQSFLNSTGNRLLLNGLMEMHDLYSHEFYSFFTDWDGLFIDYNKDKLENASKYNHLHVHAEATFTFLNCCWVQREEYIQSMYPKMLAYTNFRFMRKKHECPLGSCVCCCRKKEEVAKPALIFTHSDDDDSSSVNPPPYLKEDIEIQDLEKEIEKSLICMNQTPRINNTEWLRTLLSKQNGKPSDSNCARVSLLDGDLSYEKPSLKKHTDNRHLLTINRESTLPKIIIFRNFYTNVKEVYEFNSSGDLQSYIKMSCYSNKSQSAIKKLTPSPSKSVKDVCCWFKREININELIYTKLLKPSAAKFIRSRHMCLAGKCLCCCKKANIKGMILDDVKNPSRTDCWSAIQKIVKLNKDDFNKKFLPSVLNTEGSEVIKSGMKNSRDPVASTSTATSTNNDCKITSVRPAPRRQPAPADPLPADQMRHIANVLKDDEISGEVHTLITSILERFKDVRLTMNSDGKVAAALNTPVSSLSTVELKVLANILSYAQSQINLLGLNSGMSLSSIINMKKNDPNTDIKKNPQSNLKESHSDKHPPEAFRDPILFPQLGPTKEDTCEFFTKSLYIKNKGFNDSFKSFLSIKLDSTDRQNNVTPVIQNVFSLKKEDIHETTDNTSSTLWYRQPATEQPPSIDQNSILKKYLKLKKRTQETAASTAPKRIRVVSPSKLGASMREPGEIFNTLCKPMPLLNSHALEVGSLLPGVPLLSNPNFQVVVNHKAQAGGADDVIPTPHPAVSSDSCSKPTLVVTPLTLKSENDSTKKRAIVPVSVSHAAATVESEVPDENDDDCILDIAAFRRSLSRRAKNS